MNKRRIKAFLIGFVIGIIIRVITKDDTEYINVDKRTDEIF